MYLDRRMKNIENAIHFANSFDLLVIEKNASSLTYDGIRINLLLQFRRVSLLIPKTC